ncbi:hypothetical protein ACFX13_033144 [Malus domestica]
MVGLDFAQAIWECLRQLGLSQVSVANAANLRFCLLNLQKGSHPLHEYLQEAKSIANGLASIHQKVYDSDLVMSILRGLGADCVMFVTSILNTATLPSFSDLRQQILTYEAQAARMNPTPAAYALMAAHAPQPHNPAAAPTTQFDPTFPTSSNRQITTPVVVHRGGCSYGGFRRGVHGGGRSNLNNHPQQQWGPPNPVHGILGAPPIFWCNLCNSLGHHPTTCPHHAPPTPFARFHSLPANAVNHMADLYWYLDTSATYHMTGNGANLQDLVPYNGSSSVLLGNGDALSIAHTHYTHWTLNVVLLRSAFIPGPLPAVPQPKLTVVADSFDRPLVQLSHSAPPTNSAPAETTGGHLPVTNAHPMVTRAKVSIHRPKQHSDGIVRYPFSHALADMASSSSTEPNCYT